MDDWINQIRDLVDQAESLEDIRNGLLALAPDMDIDQYAALLSEALTAAGLAGRADILDQAARG
jgi:phage gp29-like protein